MRVLLASLLLALSASAQPAAPLAAARAAGGEPSDLAWSWSPDPRWLAPVDAGRRYFDGGLDYGANFVYTTVPDTDVPPVVIVFDPSTPSAARVFDYNRGLADAGIGRFDGAAYDVSDPEAPRRLNVGFLERSSPGPLDRVWKPDGSDTGKNEYLLIFDSTYDPTGETYAGETAYSLDTDYGLAVRVRDGHQLFETVAEMRLTPPPLRDVAVAAAGEGEAAAYWTAASYAGGTEVRLATPDGVLGTAAPSAGRLQVGGLDPSRTVDLSVQLYGPGGLIDQRTLPVQARVSEGVAAYVNVDPGLASTSTYGDVWGYTAPDGTEYALLAVRDVGIVIYDITDAPASEPSQAVIVSAPPGSSDAKDVKVYDHYAYVVNETGPIQIVDLSAPTSPVMVGTLDVQPGIPNGGAHNVLVAEDHLWVTGGRTAGNAGVRVYSLADPESPTLTDAFSPTHQPVAYYHDFEVRDGRGYGSAIYSGGGIDVLDVSDPTDLKLLTTFSYPGAGAHNTCTTEDGGTVYVGDEIGTNGNWIRVFDVRDLDDIELVGEVVVNEDAIVHNCYVRGDRLYVAHYTEGLRVFDISDPHNPVEMAYLDTYLEPGTGFRGAWTAYPYFASRKVVVSDLQSGLWVVALDGDAVPTEPKPTASAGLRAWPNPAASSLTLAFDLASPAEAEVTVTDVLGRTVAQTSTRVVAGANRLALDVADLPAGVYVARLAVDRRGREAVTVTIAR